MPKIKTRKSALKRFKITGTGKIIRARTHKSHLLEWKPAHKKRMLGTQVEISKTDLKRVQRMLPGVYHG